MDMAVNGTSTAAIKQEPVDDETDLQTEPQSDVMQETTGNFDLWSHQFIKEERIEDVKAEFKEEEELLTNTNTAAIHNDITWQDVAVKGEPCSDVEEKGDIGVAIKQEAPSRDVKIECMEHTEETKHDITTYNLEQLQEECSEQTHHYRCKKCDYVARSRINFERHVHNNLKHAPCLKRKGIKPYKCDICDYRGKTIVLLMAHNGRVHDKKKRHTCGVCGHGFFKKIGLTSHMRTHTGEKPFACDKCNIRYRQKYSLAKHVSRCTGNGSLKNNWHACDICDFTTMRASYLKSHMRIHKKTLYTCYICSYTCSKKNNLKAHVRLHMEEKPYSCSNCDKKFKTEKDLKRHSYKHTEKILACDACEFRTKCSSSLRTHIRRKHTGEKPLSCDNCDYKCTKMSDLKRHGAKHSGLKLFACDYCEYKSSRHDVLVCHTRTHTGEKPYMCDKCDYRCTQRSNLRHHKRLWHKNGNPRRVKRGGSL